MPRFFFHVVEGNSRIVDEVGLALTDVEHARREAIAGARGIMAEAVESGKRPDNQIFEITDESGRIVLRIPFQDALHD